MKLKNTSQIKARNKVVLSPLMHKGGLHETEQPRAQHRRDRKQTKHWLKQTNFE